MSRYLKASLPKSGAKESELKQLKSDLAALDRKITAQLAPKKEEQDGEENKEVNSMDTPSQSSDSKKSMVAEPASMYRGTHLRL